MQHNHGQEVTKVDCKTAIRAQQTECTCTYAQTVQAGVVTNLSLHTPRMQMVHFWLRNPILQKLLENVGKQLQKPVEAKDRLPEICAHHNCTVWNISCTKTWFIQSSWTLDMNNLHVSGHQQHFTWRESDNVVKVSSPTTTVRDPLAMWYPSCSTLVCIHWRIDNAITYFC